jgi:glucose-1-phosphate thymidylyltransferase
MPRVRKAVVLARGLGTRMREADGVALDDTQSRSADAGLKAMIPTGRPFLDYVLTAIADGGCTDVCLVIGPGPNAIREYYTTLPTRRLRIVFAVQEKAIGTANALLAAGPFVGDDPFLVLNADNYYPPAVLKALVDLEGPGLPVFEPEALVARSNIPPERVQAFALVTLAPDGSLAGIIEKPEGPRPSGPALVSMNVWRFAPDILRACRDVPLSVRGEYELPQAVQYAIARLGFVFRTVRVAEGVLDLSRRSDIPAVTARLRDVPVDL